MQLASISVFLANNWHIVILFLIIAILYASVGFGGGSSYLSILALTGLAYTQIRSTSLLCNIVVVLGNVYLFQKEQLIDWKKTLPIVIISIPMAFLGGFLKVNTSVFFIVLGVTLLIAGITMWFSINLSHKKHNENNLSTLKNSSYGAIIGFISGFVGIGGGIFLAPLLHLTKWNTPKKIAATASLFILLNSFAGLIGQIANHNFSIHHNFTLVLMGTVFIGGQIGSRLSNTILSVNQLKKATAILIVFVAIRILIKYTF